MPDPGTGAARDIYTVARLNREARLLLESGLGSVWVEAEVSNFSRPASGHWYFSLKDRDAQLRCAMFRQRNLLARCTPRDGQRVLVRGRVSLYEPRGDYQLLIEQPNTAFLRHNLKPRAGIGVWQRTPAASRHRCNLPCCCVTAKSSRPALLWISMNARPPATSPASSGLRR